MPAPRLAHVAVAVRDLQGAIERYEALGLRLGGRERVESQQVEVAFFDLGGARLELVAPCSPDAPLQRSLDRRGEGLHHIALEVTGLEGVMASARALGLPMVQDTPSVGAEGTRIAFVHPKGLCGVLVELVERPSAGPHPEAGTS